MTAPAALPKLGRPEGAPQLERLITRLLEIAPIVRQQQRDADRAVEKAYFAYADPEVARSWREDRLIALPDLLRIEYRRVTTPEARELYSIGLAVAAFGGWDAISGIGSELAERDCDDGRIAVWNQWDGMAGHWL
jgi:hypothetical protein